MKLRFFERDFYKVELMARWRLRRNQAGEESFEFQWLWFSLLRSFPVHSA
jgi:hypothetical protein